MNIICKNRIVEEFILDFIIHKLQGKKGQQTEWKMIVGKGEQRRQKTVERVDNFKEGNCSLKFFSIIKKMFNEQLNDKKDIVL